jgi:hypothetical protein
VTLRRLGSPARAVELVAERDVVSSHCGGLFSLAEAEPPASELGINSVQGCECASVSVALHVFC